MTGSPGARHRPRRPRVSHDVLRWFQYPVNGSYGSATYEMDRDSRADMAAGRLFNPHGTLRGPPAPHQYRRRSARVAGRAWRTRAMSAHRAQVELAGYFEEASRWDTDRVAAIERGARLAWLAAAAGWLCAVTCGGALMLLMPLKRVDPFVIRVDNSTGVVDVVPVYEGTAIMDESITRYFLTHYITVCERFNYSTAESDYEECGAFHGAPRNQAWAALWNPNNPSSVSYTHLT